MCHLFQLHLSNLFSGSFQPQVVLTEYVYELSIYKVLRLV